MIPDLPIVRRYLGGANAQARPLRVLAIDGTAEKLAQALAADASAHGVEHQLVCTEPFENDPAVPGVTVANASGGTDRTFDYIDATADLQDLSKPDSVLAVHLSNLAADGVVAARVPGALGNLGRQDVRDGLALLPAARRTADTCAEIIAALPSTHRLRRGPQVFDGNQPPDFLAPGPPAQTVRSMADWLADRGLALAALLPAARYDLSRRANDPELQEMFAALSWLEQSVVAELLTGDIVEHLFLARPNAGESPAAGSSAAMPNLRGQVQSHYESFPYPARDPADERRRLLTGTPSDLSELNHYSFGGRRDFRQPFRVLVAGGGPGDASIMLAQQLTDAHALAEVVLLDISRPSIEVARARADVRGLTNLRFVEGSLLDLATLDLGRFDYIDCCGVLHHLPDPLAGLRQLTAALAEGGGMGLMLYGALGRTGIYHLQEILRLVAPPGLPDGERLSRTRLLLRALPESTWFRRNPFLHDHEVSDAAATICFSTPATGPIGCPRSMRCAKRPASAW